MRTSASWACFIAGPASAISCVPASVGDTLRVVRAPQSAAFGEVAVDGYDSPASIKAQWAGYHRTQTGDPAKLGAAIVQLAAMAAPPSQFFAGSDAVRAITADLGARLDAALAHQALSSSTDGAS